MFYCGCGLPKDMGNKASIHDKKNRTIQDISNIRKVKAMEKEKKVAIKLEFIEKQNENETVIICPICKSTDIEQFGFSGYECNNCGLRIS